MVLGGDIRWLVAGLTFPLGGISHSVAAEASQAVRLRPDSSPAFLSSAPVAAAPLRGLPLMLAQADLPASDAVDPDASPEILRFEIRSYHIDGNTLLSPADIARELAPFTGAQRDFGDVQRALEALQALYQQKGHGSQFLQGVTLCDRWRLQLRKGMTSWA